MPPSDIVLSMPPSDIVLSLGLVLAAALAGGLVAHTLHLPRVTAYLIVGMVLGPSTLNLVPEEHVGHLDPIGKLAMALVLLNMGCHFTVQHFRLMARRTLRLSVGETGLTFLLVAGGLLLLGQQWQAAVLFGALAIATAPATTSLVLKEMDSEGPVTELSITLVALNNLLAVVVFEVLLALVCLSMPVAATPSFVWALQQLAADLIGSVLMGVSAGLVVSYVCGLWPRERWLVLLVAVTTLVLGSCLQLEVPYLLTFLAMGTTIACASDRSSEVVAELDRVTGLVCVVFFVISGAELNLADLWDAGLVGVAYIVLRSLGKYFGVYLASDPHQDTPQVHRWLGATLLPQAGAAIVMTAVAVDVASEMGLGNLGEDLRTVILGTVVFFEIVGPVAIRQAVVRSGEVPLDHLIHHTTTTPLEQLQLLGNRIVVAFGFNPWQRRLSQEVTIGRLVRRNIRGIPATANFEAVADFIEQSHDNVFAVVDDEKTLVGIIRYADLRDALFDPELGDLVCAADLAMDATDTLGPDDSVAHGLEIFRHGDDDCLPVVTDEPPGQLLGMVRRRDLFRYFLRSSGRSDQKGQ